jgi:hypothetical protein
MSDAPLLPGMAELKALAAKARAEEPFSVFEYRLVAHALEFLVTDSMYWFKQGAAKGKV